MIKESILKSKITACWLGKAVGGTLGQPYEGKTGPLSLEFYNPVPEDMIPNDDLDLQVLWACTLDQMAVPQVDRMVLGQAWVKHVGFPWDEYGICLRNLKRGIMPPFSGSYDNWFIDGLGAAIRSEIWACLAPGNPKLAAAYAYEDACTDHAENGLYAEVFLAAMESHAFVCNSISECIEVGLSFIPEELTLKQAVMDTINWCKEYNDWLIIRSKIIEKYGSENFTNVLMNVPFMVLALLLGKGDFSTTVCLAVNCGRDADCTAATVGAFMGIFASECIGNKWLRPIGRKLVINKEITGIAPPDTLDEFTDMILRIEKRLNGFMPSSATVSMPKDKFLSYTVETSLGQCNGLDHWFHISSTPEHVGKIELRQFHSSYNSIPAAEIPPDHYMLMKYRFRLDKAMNVAIMFNTPESCWVWIDDKNMFGRECGRMVPSFHRVPPNQGGCIDLEAGEHVMTVGILPYTGRKQIEWVTGLGRGDNMQWLEHQFLTQKDFKFYESRDFSTAVSA